MKNKIKFVCKAVKWFDKVNGNTYHSVRVTRCNDGAVCVGQFQYGYGEQYRYTALELMLDNGWLGKKGIGRIVGNKVKEYTSENLWSFERDNKYPILWEESKGLKRDCVSNGIL